MKTRLFITNLSQLETALNSSRNDLIVETFTNEDQQVTQFFIGDTPSGGTININPTEEYEHLDSYNMEINHNYTGEYEFKNINFKHVLYLLTQEEII